MPKQDLVRRLSNQYRKAFPQLKFSVKRVPLSKNFELTGFTYADGKFVIEICKSHKDDMACFLLAHAIAHATSWHLCPPEEPHAKPFWDAYQMTYKIYEEFCDKVSK